MDDTAKLKDDLKKLMIEELMLQISADEISDDALLFRPEGLGLDSVDALQLVVALEKNYGVKVPDPGAAKEILQSVNTMVAAIQKKQSE